jgi:hypothetical protein
MPNKPNEQLTNAQETLAEQLKGYLAHALKFRSRGLTSDSIQIVWGDNDTTIRLVGKAGTVPAYHLELTKAMSQLTGETVRNNPGASSGIECTVPYPVDALQGCLANARHRNPW